LISDKTFRRHIGLVVDGEDDVNNVINNDDMMTGFLGESGTGSLQLVSCVCRLWCNTDEPFCFPVVRAYMHA